MREELAVSGWQRMAKWRYGGGVSRHGAGGGVSEMARNGMAAAETGSMAA
jgi:hypothetical protein